MGLMGTLQDNQTNPPLKSRMPTKVEQAHSCSCLGLQLLLPCLDVPLSLRRTRRPEDMQPCHEIVGVWPLPLNCKMQPCVTSHSSQVHTYLLQLLLLVGQFSLDCFKFLQLFVYFLSVQRDKFAGTQYTVVYCGIIWCTVIYCGALWYNVIYCGIL